MPTPAQLAHSDQAHAKARQHAQAAPGNIGVVRAHPEPNTPCSKGDCTRIAVTAYVIAYHSGNSHVINACTTHEDEAGRTVLEVVGLGDN